MKLNSILSVFTPKEGKFLPLLQETTTILVQASTYLQELFRLTEKEKRKELCSLIKTEEVKGDKVTGAIVNALHETFLTPLDREDIDALADELDDVIDAINRTSQKVLLYSPDNLPDSTRQLTDIIKKGALEVQGAVQELSHLKHSDKKLRAHYKEIKRLEEEADVLYEKGIIKLFKEETNAVELIKLKEIIQELEKTANRINSTGKVLKTIFVKYA
jgi:predicted phosphate transport protein (TIGR00153 family)